MKRKIGVILFFIVVFGLPVAWYLFLQFFGENKFELPKITEWNQECTEVITPALAIKNGAFESFPNQWSRVEGRIDQQNLISIQQVVDCDLENDLYLIDGEGWVRGEFVVSREEIDRLLAEIDILVLNDNESDSRK